MKKLLITGLLALCLLTQNLLSQTAWAEDANDSVPLKTVTLSEWEAVLKSHQGEIVVVDFWATWCISCLERFPHMVTMSERYQSKKVRFISMLLEDPEEPEAIALAHQFLNKQFLNKQLKGKNGLAFDHYSMNENLMKSFEVLDLLGIPAVFIYNKGQLTHRLTGDNPNKQFTDKDIEEAILALLKSS